MNRLYLSTCRKPTQLTRKFARLLSLILSAEYENRGKRSVDDICARAEKAGCTKIAFIYEKKGNPSRIQFYDDKKGWLEEEVLITGTNIPARKDGGRIPPNIMVLAEDGTGKRIADLFGLEQEIEDETSLLEGKFFESGIQFSLKGELILAIKCKFSNSKK